MRKKHILHEARSILLSFRPSSLSRMRSEVGDYGEQLKLELQEGARRAVPFHFKELLD
jgi:hypothetical protein